MNTDITTEKKKKRPQRRRWRIMLYIIPVLLVIGVAGMAIKPWLEQYTFYQQRLWLSEARDKKVYSPDGTRYAVPSINNFDSTGGGWLMDTVAQRTYSLMYSDALFTGAAWTADSRFVLLSSSNHYGMGRLIAFDMERGQYVDTPHPCYMFTMSVCDSEYVITVAPVSPMFINRLGTLVDLRTGTETILLNEPVGRSIVQALWSPSEASLFALAIFSLPHPADGNTLTYTYRAAGYFLNADGTHPVEAFSLDEDKSQAWVDSRNRSDTSDDYCAWTEDESTVTCTISQKEYVLKKD